MKKLELKKHGDISVVVVTPELSQSDYMEMRKYLTETLFINGDIRLVIDCEMVEELPSIAFGVFCSITRDVVRAGGKFGLIHVSECIKNIMEKTHIDRQINVFNTLTEAVKAFS